MKKIFQGGQVSDILLPMSTIGIIGYGVVGQATASGFGKNNKIIWNDPGRKGSTSLKKIASSAEYIFICVPTPMFSDFSGIDLSIVDQVVDEISPLIKGSDKVLIIKSTVVPGTTARYSKKYAGVRFAMNPEFLTEVNAPWDFIHTDRIVIGAMDEADATRIARLHREIMGYEVKIFLTDTTTAEMVKYMSNCYMATKIIFGNEMKELSDKLKINYSDVAEMVGYDKRIGHSFLKVSPWRGFGLKCFPKDTVALLGLAKKMRVDLSILKAVWKKNLKVREVRDWEDIQGAMNGKTVSKK